MAKVSYALRPGEPKRLEISWKLFYRDIVVRLDGQEVGGFANRKLLEAGQDFSLPDGSVLRVQLPPRTLANIFESPLPQAWVNGQAVPESNADPRAQLKSAFICIFVIAGFNLFVSVPVIIWQPAVLGGMVGGFSLLFFGLLFTGLGFLVRQRSAIALGFAFWIFLLDSLYFVWAIGASTPSQPGAVPRLNFSAVILRIFLLAGMWRGFEAIQALKQNQTSPENSGPG